jgi:hypothetical protein
MPIMTQFNAQAVQMGRSEGLKFMRGTRDSGASLRLTRAPNPALPKALVSPASVWARGFSCGGRSVPR